MASGHQTSFAVVGAGLAGLAAADELQRSGHEVTVLEARERVGGRVHSRRLENGATVEMGAEFILPGSTLTHELVERHGLGLWEKGMFYGHREPRGGPQIDAAALRSAFQVAADALAADPALGSLPAGEFLQGLEIDDSAREVVRARLEISSASSADHVPARSLSHLGQIDEEPAPSIAGGNDRLAQALAAELGDRVKLEAAVRRLAWDESGVRLSTDGGEVTADACVVAVPASVAEGLGFEPALPPMVSRALSAINYGHAAKLFVPLAGAPEASAVMSVPERYWTWTATGEGEAAQPVLNCFAGSPTALDRLGIAAGPERWLQSVRELRPELELSSTGIVVSTWDDDPWVRAAYSSDVPEDAATALEEPVGPVVFAGEHLGGEFAGLMEGALRSGRRAARQLAGGLP